MSGLDPRVLAFALVDLQDNLVRWGSAAAEALHTAEDEQRQTAERVNRTIHHAHIVAERAQQDLMASQHACQIETGLLDQCHEAIAASEAAQHTATNLLGRVQHTARHWSKELSAAQAWLLRAEQRLERALAELAAAEQELRSAQWDLSSAESSLRA